LKLDVSNFVNRLACYGVGSAIEHFLYQTNVDIKVEWFLTTVAIKSKNIR